MNIILIRHGETETNEHNKVKYSLVSGQSESDLTPEGMRQAQRLRHNPFLLGVDEIYASDLRRAVDTARIIFGSGTKVSVSTLLRERSLGVMEGMTVDEIMRNPQLAPYFLTKELKAFRHSYEIRPPGGEHYGDVRSRVEQFITENIKATDKKYVIVSHMCTIRCLLQHLLKLDCDTTLQLRVPNCVPIVLSDGNGAATLEVSHPTNYLNAYGNMTACCAAC